MGGVNQKQLQCISWGGSCYWCGTLALASRLASASAAMALWSCKGNLTSLISTRSTLMPQSSVATSRADWQEGKTKNIYMYIFQQFSVGQNNVVSSGRKFKIIYFQSKNVFFCAGELKVQGVKFLRKSA